MSNTQEKVDLILARSAHLMSLQNQWTVAGKQILGTLFVLFRPALPSLAKTFMEILPANTGRGDILNYLSKNFAVFLKFTNVLPAYEKLQFLAEFQNAPTSTLDEFVNDPTLIDAWKILLDRNPTDILRVNIRVLKYMNEIRINPVLGVATIMPPSILLNNYRGRFYETCRGASQNMQIHHAVPQVLQRNFPNLLTESQLHSLENLRGISNTQMFNGKTLHPHITNLWESWRKINLNPTLSQILDYTKQIDDTFGHLFIPPIR